MKYILKNKLRILLIALILIIAVYFLYIKNNPNSSSNLPVKEQLEIFYEAFMVRDYTTIAEINIDYNPQTVINERHFYGDVYDYKIKSIKSIDDHHKKAKITVRSIRNDKSTKNTDTMHFIKEYGTWKFKSYSTNFRYKLP